MMLRQGFEDEALPGTEVHLRLAAAQDGLGNSALALGTLQAAVAAHPLDAPAQLALAKMLFRVDRKRESLELCRELCRRHADQGGGWVRLCGGGSGGAALTLSAAGGRVGRRGGGRAAAGVAGAPGAG